tara:strand:- start:3031 stop:3303 length:273 start_codon:yes stop_codon:yes gene_type:complete
MFYTRCYVALIVMDTEKFLDWLVELDIAHYKATKEGDYDPKCNSHLYLKGSQERFTSKEMIEIFSNNASDKTNENWQYAIAEHSNWKARH